MITASAALLLVVAAAGLPATASTRPGPAQSHERDVTALFDQAVKRVRADSDFSEASPFLEDQRINKPPEMKLKEAVSLLKKAGYRDGFSNVTLRRPLGPDKTPPLYIFGVAQGSFVAVNTKTEKVSPLS